MYENRMQLRFGSISQNESFARTVAAAFAAQLNPTIEELTDIRTAVSEAVTNAIIHGYENNPNRAVELRCSICGDMLTIVVADEGKGIEDVMLAMQPFYTSVPSLERSGMGFAVMEAFMDDVRVESAPGQGTKVTMQKHIAVVGCDG
ncbi:MAG: anti-sigma F factor [Christensenellaceae bacterium]|jgi:stage II sporulation protein AB (anti-sigma F factor)|nr:anti-sigma F factor [Christensenellaceae bacterium]